MHRMPCLFSVRLLVQHFYCQFIVLQCTSMCINQHIVAMHCDRSSPCRLTPNSTAAIVARRQEVIVKATASSTSGTVENKKILNHLECTLLRVEYAQYGCGGTRKEKRRIVVDLSFRSQRMNALYTITHQRWPYCREVEEQLQQWPRDGHDFP